MYEAEAARRYEAVAGKALVKSDATAARGCVWRSSETIMLRMYGRVNEWGADRSQHRGFDIDWVRAA
jgi:hypothetical protein